MTEKKRRGTATSNFGVGAREGHDASAFYGRFRAPELSTDDTVLAPAPVAEPFVHGDSRAMTSIASGSVALVVTSPPYFVGKQYEEELLREGIPSSYLEYLEMLTDVFRECVRTLEPGGRIAVNVANLGRKPYRSLSADVIRILEHDLGLLLRGELIWQKGDGASGSCAWGSFRGAGNPVLRDLSERVIVASKGRFDRAQSVKQRAKAGLPHVSSIGTDDFLEATLDVWEMPTESAKRVGHPAPFPIDLPEQLIQLYTFENDLVLDPFMGSGTTMVAAALHGRRYVGYDLDPAYIAIARERVGVALASAHDAADVPARTNADDGMSASNLTELRLREAGFEHIAKDSRVPSTGIKVSFRARDRTGGEWLFDIAGPATARRGGMLRNEVVWRTLGRAHVVRGRASASAPTPYVIVTTDLPRRGSEGDKALRAAGMDAFFDAIDLRSPAAATRLRTYATSGHQRLALPGFWSPA